MQKLSKIAKTTSIFTWPLSVTRQIVREFAEIDHVFACHGISGKDRKALEEKAKERSRTTTMSFRQAIEEVVFEDKDKRLQPIGPLNKDDFDLSLWEEQIEGSWDMKEEDRG